MYREDDDLGDEGREEEGRAIYGERREGGKHDDENDPGGITLHPHPQLQNRPTRSCHRSPRIRPCDRLDGYPIVVTGFRAPSLYVHKHSEKSYGYVTRREGGLGKLESLNAQERIQS